MDSQYKGFTGGFINFTDGLLVYLIENRNHANWFK